MQEVTVLYVMAADQVNEKTLRFVDELGLREHVRFLADPESRLIDALGLRKQDPEPIESGVPHPATYVIDRRGVTRFADVREDFHVWLDPGLLVEVLDALR